MMAKLITRPKHDADWWKEHATVELVGLFNKHIEKSPCKIRYNSYKFLKSADGFNRLSVCEMWHCTYSEFEEKLLTPNGLRDYALAIAYMKRKDELEREAMEEASMKR